MAKIGRNEIIPLCSSVASVVKKGFEMATTAIPTSKISGGSFLLEERKGDEVFTPEDFSEQHQLIGQTAEEFAVNEIVPNIEKMEHKDFSVTRDLLKKAGELGLSSAEIPEAYGGLEMDKVTAAVSADYILNGEKMWITNAGFADLFTVFAKVDGEKFTAFLVERTFPGFSVGAEEHKMGIRGSSTCPIILNDCLVPSENLLGDIGKGHLIAFNILNIGRFKLGAMCVGGARSSLDNAVGYAKQRKAFGKVIADFGLVREKLANMAALIYVGESLVFRTVGMMDTALASVDKSADDSRKLTLKAIEEYAVECSIIKVWASEMVDYVVDETVQIYGGYGFVEEYPAERAYRDARINRIFEGTNEINRLIITGFLLKRAMTGKLPLMAAIKQLMDEVLAGPSPTDDEEGPLAEERKLVAAAKKIGLFAAGAATQKYMQQIEQQQEIMGAIADMVIELYAMESALLRTMKSVVSQGEAVGQLSLAMTRLYCSQAMEKVESAARKIITAVTEGDMLLTQLAILRRLAKHTPYNTIGLRQEIAQAIVDRGSCPRE